MNDVDSVELDPPPIVGGVPNSVGTILGADPALAPAGRATSPRLYAHAALHPSCTQLRVWKIESGNPVGLGAVDARATEEDFVRQFVAAMPKPGEGKAEFTIRPVDIRGQPLGTEATVLIHEHHQSLQSIRNAQVNGAQAAANLGLGGSPGLAPEVMGLLKQQIELSEARARSLERSLELERERVRKDDEERAKERIDLATNAATGVQALSERMMNDEARRAEMALKQQADRDAAARTQMNDQSSALMTTLTSIFAQQQATQQAAEDARRRMDEMRIDQERQRAERDRIEAEDRRKRERDDYEFRMKREAEEAQRKLESERTAIDVKLQRERAELDAKLAKEQSDAERRERFSREDAERKERLGKEELDRRERTGKEELERREKREGEMSREREQERQRQHERMLKEMDLAATQQREHAERMMALSKQEIAGTGGNGLIELLPKAATLLKAIGIEPSELVQRALGIGTDEANAAASVSWADALPKVISVVGDVWRENIRAKSTQMPQIAGPGIPMIAGPGGMFPATMGPGGPMPEPIPAGAETTEPVPTNSPTPVPQGEPTNNLVDIATRAGLGLPAQRNARKALRELARAIRGAKPEGWAALVTEAIAAEPTIWHYVNAVSVRNALVEAGAEQDLAQRIIEGLKESPLVPKDLRYD